MENTDTTPGDNAHRDRITAAAGAHPVVADDDWHASLAWGRARVRQSLR